MTAHIPEGTLGIGVGELWEPIPERGEDPAGYFHSIVWFPADDLAAAQAFADEHGYVLREGIPL